MRSRKVSAFPPQSGTERIGRASRLSHGHPRSVEDLPQANRRTNIGIVISAKMPIEAARSSDEAYLRPVLVPSPRRMVDSRFVCPLGLHRPKVGDVKSDVGLGKRHRDRHPGFPFNTRPKSFAFGT